MNAFMGRLGVPSLLRACLRKSTFSSSVKTGLDTSTFINWDNKLTFVRRVGGGVGAVMVCDVDCTALIVMASVERGLSVGSE